MNTGNIRLHFSALRHKLTSDKRLVGASVRLNLDGNAFAKAVEMFHSLPVCVCELYCTVCSVTELF